MADHSPLDIEIRQRIARDGPLSVTDYMTACLMDAAHGYYATHDPIGQAGDFTTAPEISQMFGELIGAWTAAVWRMLGAPAILNLVELGPGRGTMMADVLRAAKVAPGFARALSIHLVETSPILRAHQRKLRSQTDQPIFWHDSLREIADGPSIILANEFFDALPVHQAVRQRDGWHERVVEIDEGGRLKFGVAIEPLGGSTPVIPDHLADAPVGAIFEWRTPDVAFDLARRVAHGGAALIIDYGHTRSAVGDTLQAVRGHTHADPLAAAGRCDLSAHVDFDALAQVATRAGVRTFGPIAQAVFLRRLGIVERAAALKAKASAEQARAIDAALARLTDEHTTGMGRMFKVLGLAAPQLGALPGFET